MVKTIKERIAKIKKDEAAKRERLKLRERLRREKLKAKPPKLEALKDALWKITSQIVRLKASTCYTCDKALAYAERAAGHYWSKGGHNSVRFDLRNLRVQCTSCNSFRSGNLAEYGIRLLQELGEAEFNRLASLAHTLKKWNDRDELKALIEERTNMLNELKHEN